MPECYEPWHSVFMRKWKNDGILEEIFHTLSSDTDMENLNIDSTAAKAHQSTNSEFKKGLKNLYEEYVEDLTQTFMRL